MGNCCCNTLKTEESRCSVSFEKKEQSNAAEKSFSSHENHAISLLPIMSPLIKPIIHSEFDTFADCKDEFNSSYSLNFLKVIGKCICGGNFKYHESLVFDNFNLHKSWNINCSICLKFFSDAGWKCENCSQTVCLECGNLQNFYKPLAECLKNHSLTFYADTTAWQTEKFGKSSYTCTGCLQEKREPSWSCRACNFNLCLNCSYSKDLHPPLNTLLCYEKKRLSFSKVTEANNENLQCSKCFNYPKQERYVCNDCEFSICGNCMVEESLKMSQHPGLRCTKGHELKIGLLKSIKKKKKTWIICARCSAVSMKFAYACNRCEQYMCIECASDITFKIRINTGKTCENGHFLLWSVLGDHGKEDFECEKCCKRFELNCFRCKQCEYDVCVDCIEQNEFLTRKLYN